MNLPPEPRNERRVVPRHIRDGEHTWTDEGTTSENHGATGGRRRLWIWSAVLIVLLAALGFLLSRGA